jgi:hypothetical protein
MIDALPDAMLLRPRRTKWILLLAVSLAFAVGGGVMARGGKPEGYLGLAFFGLCALVAAAMLLPGTAYLRLTRDGFEVRSLFRSRQTRWADVGELRAGRIGLNAMVVFNFAPTYARAKKLRAVASVLTGVEGAIPDTYGYSAKDLAGLLNQWRSRAAQTRPA